MDRFKLPKQVKGVELTDFIRRAAEDIDFKFYNFDGRVSVARMFPEHVPEELRFAFDTTPSLEFRFGELDPNAEYKSVDCEPMIGTMRVQPTNFTGDEAKYKIYYQLFIQRLASYLKQ